MALLSTWPVKSEVFLTPKNYLGMSLRGWRCEVAWWVAEEDG